MGNEFLPGLPRTKIGVVLPDIIPNKAEVVRRWHERQQREWNQDPYRLEQPVSQPVSQPRNLEATGTPSTFLQQFIPKQAPVEQPTAQPAMAFSALLKALQPKDDLTAMVNANYRGTPLWGGGAHIKALEAARKGTRDEVAQRINLLSELLGHERGKAATGATTKLGALSALLQSTPNETGQFMKALELQAAPELQRLFEGEDNKPSPVATRLQELIQASSARRNQYLDLLNAMLGGYQQDATSSVLQSILGAGPSNQGSIQWSENKAEGGEVGGLPLDASAVVDMDSGDYIVPVEAVRFYGRKFFKDLEAKAEDANL